jgi:hypothetical protein
MPPEDGVVIFGLFIDGARWDLNSGCLNDSLPGQRFSKLPQIHFKPVQVNLQIIMLKQYTPTSFKRGINTGKSKSIAVSFVSTIF